MKKAPISPTLIVLFGTMLIVGYLAYLQSRSNVLINDKKSKLTLLNTAIKTAQKVPVLNTIIVKDIAKQNTAPHHQDESQNIITTERVYTEAEINEMTEEKFIELLKDTEKRLPKLSDIKKIPAEALHRTPPEIISAGRDLGVIKEVLKVHESYEKLATPFYKNCAKNDLGTTPVRALCLTNLIEIKKKHKETLNLNEYPDKLIELSKMITDM